MIIRGILENRILEGPDCLNYYPYQELIKHKRPTRW